MVGLEVGSVFYEIGSSDFMFSFFSTINYHLENKRWGRNYPYIMIKLYKSTLRSKDIPRAMEEINLIRQKLKTFSPTDVIWNIENLNKKPPWGSEISEEITNLAQYFVTCNGFDLFDVIESAFAEGVEENEDITIINL